MHQLFEGPLLEGLFDGDYYKQLPLKKNVNNFTSHHVMYYLLQNRNLDGKENERYMLLCSWITHWPLLESLGDRRKEVMMISYKHLISQVHFGKMTTDFLANVLPACPLATDSGLLPYIMHSVFSAPNDLKECLTGEKSNELLSEQDDGKWEKSSLTRVF